MTVYTAGEWTPADRAAYIAEPMGDAVAAFVEISRRLNEQKEATPHGEWGNVVALLPWAESTTRALMTISRNEAIANRLHASDLPASWTTLAVLARVPADELGDLIDRGQITPDTERAQAQAIADQFNGARLEALRGWAEFTQAMRTARAYIGGGHTPPSDLPPDATAPAVVEEWAIIIAQEANKWQ